MKILVMACKCFACLSVVKIRPVIAHKTIHTNNNRERRRFTWFDATSYVIQQCAHVHKESPIVIHSMQKEYNNRFRVEKS